MIEDAWTTRVQPDLTARYGVGEVHYVWFAPKGWPGKGPTFTLLVPECEMQFSKIAPDGKPETIIHRPPNKNVKSWIRIVCETARDCGASVSFACDTAEQAERAAQLANKLLPKHERIALERMYAGGTRDRSNLN